MRPAAPPACIGVLATAVAGLSLLAAGGCDTDPTIDGVAAIEAAEERYLEAFNASDLDGVAAIYAPDAVALPPGEPALEGRAAIRGHLEELFEEYRPRQTLDNREVVVDGEWGRVWGTWELILEPREGDRTLVQAGTHLVIWRRFADGRWLAVRDLWNTDGPPRTP